MGIVYSPHPLSWEDQFRVLKRWYYRLQGAEGGTSNFFTTKETYLEDYYRAFFIACFQIKDWFEHDNVGTSKEIQQHIKNNFALRLAGDLCNFSKHAQLVSNKKPWVKPWTGDPNTQGIGQMYGVFPSDGSQHYVVSLFKIESGGREFDAFQIAQECMDAWGNFLISKSLPTPELLEEKIFANFPVWQPAQKGQI